MFGYDSSFSQAPDMAIQKQLQILTESEINDLYSPPCFSLEERRFYFALNDLETTVVKSIRLRGTGDFKLAWSDLRRSPR